MKKTLDHIPFVLRGDDGGFGFLNYNGIGLKFIASWGMGWDHVSVSCRNRVPSWQEMCYVKSVFFDPEECVMQLHPPESRYINCHPNVLHLWRPQHEPVPQPPLEMV